MPSLLLSSLLFWRSAGAFESSQEKEDYLTDEEIEQLRDVQEPPYRMDLLNKFLTKRFDWVRSASTTKGPDQEETPEGSSPKDFPGEKEVPQTAGSDTARNKHDKVVQKTLRETLNVYLNCLDEVSSNLESARALPLDLKAYLKSLNKLNESLQKQIQWFNALETKSLKKTERETVEEIKQAQVELQEDIENSTGQLVEQIKKMKEAKKAEEKKE